MGHGVRAHGAAEHQQNGGQNGGLDHGQRDLAHGLPLGGVQDRGGLFQIGVHVPENAADEDVGKRRVVQSQHHQAGKQPLAPPKRHVDAQCGGQQSVGGSGDRIGVKEVLPHHGQRPLGHDVGEDENRAEVLPPGQIGAGDQKGEHTAEENGHHAGPNGQIQRVQQGAPQVGFGQVTGKEVDVVDQGVTADLAGKVRVNGSGMDLEGIFHNGHHRSNGGDGHHDAHQQQDHIVGLGKKGQNLVPNNPGPACTQGG